VALEREKMRAQEMARLRGSAPADSRNIRSGAETKAYMKNVVERFNLRKAFQDDATVEKLAMAGYRGQGHLTTYLFARFVSPLAIFIIAALYLLVLNPGDRPLYLNLVYAIGAGLLGAYLPNVLLKNTTQ